MPRAFDVGIDVVARTNHLTTAVRENRDKHASEYEEAAIAWKTKALDEIEDMTQRIERGEVFQAYSKLPVPEKHIEDYDRALRMLAMHTEETITLTEEAHRCLVEDEWSWKGAWAANTASYLANSK